MSEGTSLALHRCRFVDYTPSPITAIAFPPARLPSVHQKASSSGKQARRFGTLAVGHANGNIDLYEWTGAQGSSQSAQAWALRVTLSGPYPSKVDSLAFALRDPEALSEDAVPSLSELRLFSSGGGSDLIEWDLSKKCVRRTAGSQGGSIWSMAVNPASTMLALGCEDGTVRLLNLDLDALTHHRRFDRVKCRVLSVAWGPPVPPQASARAPAAGDDSSDDEDENWTDSWLVTGGSDSSLRKWDVSTGRILDRMGTDRVRGERTLVWSVGVLGDGTIISGDSMGRVKFWDSRTCTQLQTFQAHGADVLCLAIDATGTAVYTSGVDQKISQFCYSKTTVGGRKWIQTGSRRMHSHDVRALAVWPPYSPISPSHRKPYTTEVAPILASGGLDMSVVITPAALPMNTVVKMTNPIATSIHCTFEDSYHRRLAYPPGPSSTAAIRVAREARLICCLRDTGLTLWRLLKTTGEDSQSSGWEKLIDMELNVQTNLVACAISNNGRWLVASDLHETKLFSLSFQDDGTVKPRRIRQFSALLQSHLLAKNGATGSIAFTFTPDSSKLILSTAAESYLVVVDLAEEPKVLRRFEHHRLSNASLSDRAIKGRAAQTDEPETPEDETTERANITSILRLATSFDGQWLASSDIHGRSHVYNMDLLQHHCVLPSFPQAAQALSFDPSRPNLLVLAFPDNSIQLFDVEAKQFPSWAKDISNNLPKKLTRTHDHILGVTCDPSGRLPRHILCWGSTWMCKLKLDDSGKPSRRKRRRDDKPDGSDESSFKMITHYRPLLHVDFLASGDLVVVERPLVDVLSTLPPAYFAPKYGVT
ncbi:unnamed protein product [Mycena citricolor]|uniref:WD40 repeat-like protein n=1 Tax=Mycena citricolor TaxID=2018698 RepID=A0AAD2HPW8_9AGAR|nr:unnamed protein product [Mycena citricolor]